MPIAFINRIYQNLSQPTEDICCCIDEIPTTYVGFSDLVGKYQAAIMSSSRDIVGVITQNRAETYAAIVATWLSGKAWVPINPEYPHSRIESIIQQTGIADIFCAQIPDVAFELPAGTQLHPISELKASDIQFHAYHKSSTAYVLFTSGTTGIPKGVPISYGNLQAFFDGFEYLGYPLESSDRYLQMFELTFDLSIFSFATPLLFGASFYTLPSGMIKTLGLYHVLESHQITISLMVPSAIHLLQPYMEDIDLPDLKLSMFCGEALKSSTVEQWMGCVPNADILNVYGPTEATIFCTTEKINRDTLPVQSSHGVCHIGSPMRHVECMIWDDEAAVTSYLAMGELCLAGDQLTAGYLNNPEQNQSRFFEYKGTRYYKTGDLCSLTELGTIRYLGRSDDQIKIQGFRVELGELEVAAGKVTQGKVSVAVGFEDLQGNTHLALFVQGTSLPLDEIKAKIAKIIPGYMNPTLVLEIMEFPLNSNGKIDKKELRNMAINAG